MTGSVDKVKNIFLAVSSRVWQTDRLAFNRNAPFSFYVHIIEELVTEFPVAHHFADLNKPVGKSGFPMINMGDDAKVSDIIHMFK